MRTVIVVICIGTVFVGVATSAAWMQSANKPLRAEAAPQTEPLRAEVPQQTAVNSAAVDPTVPLVLPLL